LVGFVAGACLVSGLILLDRWQVGEFGLSQPIVACPLLGFALGEVAAGVYLGLVLQLVWAASLPLGREQALDYQGAGVASILAYALLVRLLGSASGNDGRALFGAMALAGVMTFVGAWLDSANKTFNNRLFMAGDAASGTGKVVLLSLAGIGTGLVRGVVLAGVALGAAWAGAPLLLRAPAFSKAELLALPMGIGIAAAVRMFVDRKRLTWAIAGALAAGAAWLVVKV
jgi:mannose/fructose/N-acetylgalactosamine-specific phosphotransferase system component IIC